MIRTFSELPGDGESIDIRKHDVEDNGVKSRRRGNSESLSPVTGHADLIALLAQPALEQASHLGLVFHYKNLHCYLVNMLPNDSEKKLKSSFSHLSG